LSTGIIDKIEPILAKLANKGNTRFTMVQAILADYVECETDKDKLHTLADLIKEKLPALLASREGLKVACVFFNILDAKDRKTAVKNLPINEMVTNKLAHLFIIHIANTLDDTQLTKKKILHEALKLLDDHIEDRCFQSVLISALTPPVQSAQKDKDSKVFYNPFITAEDIKCFKAGQEHSTSKKEAMTRHRELVKIVQKPLEIFFEEKLQYYLLEPKGNPVLKALLVAIASNCTFEASDMLDELLRQVQKKLSFEKNEPGVAKLLLGHPIVHRLLKDTVKAEA
jgi:hypothetical protein